MRAIPTEVRRIRSSVKVAYRATRIFTYYFRFLVNPFAFFCAPSRSWHPHQRIHVS
jgi:hypothetical protein